MSKRDAAYWERRRQREETAKRMEEIERATREAQAEEDLLESFWEDEKGGYGGY